MKKACSIFLLFVFSFNLVGVTILFKVQQFQIRCEIKRQILRGVPDEKLYAIPVSEANASDFFWLEDDEFFYQGSMYDVVRKVALSETEAVYYCINDVLEKNLFANLDALIKHSKPGHEPWSNMVKKLYNFLAGLYFKDQEAIPFRSILNFRSSWYFFNTYRSIFLSITSPPPRTPHSLI
ncbi:hypothetical protein [Salmonirosea aquatica]|uniref:Uncharacterized protein n=1 Tax=Salmonirosea aquatica TaxID=2654236 RepID=A0A7C9F3E4_9BACT|nr:hypothetical protein [Cytophagaceae bacterium SJW1-29]